MTSLALTPVNAKYSAADVIGPYSDWPRRKPHRFKRPAAYAASIGLLGVILHCVVPLIA